jgi:ubiquitin C-terminal hydrolase
MSQEKSRTGYVGLNNPGCICYMNSSIQQLFMMTELREAILRINQKNLIDPKENLLH